MKSKIAGFLGNKISPEAYVTILRIVQLLSAWTRETDAGDSNLPDLKISNTEHFLTGIISNRLIFFDRESLTDFSYWWC